MDKREFLQDVAGALVIVVMFYVSFVIAVHLETSAVVSFP